MVWGHELISRSLFLGAYSPKPSVFLDCHRLYFHLAINNRPCAPVLPVLHLWEQCPVPSTKIPAPSKPIAYTEINHAPAVDAPRDWSKRNRPIAKANVKRPAIMKLVTCVAESKRTDGMTQRIVIRTGGPCNEPHNGEERTDYCAANQQHSCRHSALVIADLCLLHTYPPWGH